MKRLRFVFGCATRAGAFRVVYVARFVDAVYVLHAFQKKSEKTARGDLALAERRYREARALSKEGESWPRE